MSARPLKPSYEKFCQYVAEGKTQAEAYTLVYPKSVKWKQSTLWPRASRIMARPEIQERVRELRAIVADHALVDTTILLREAMRIATSDIGGIVREGKVLLPSELDAKTRAAVASFEIDEYGRIKYKFWDKNAALDKLFRHMGLYEADNRQKPTELVGEVRLVALQPAPRKEPDGDPG